MTKLYLLNKDAEPGCFNSTRVWPNHGWASEGLASYYGQMIDTVKEGDVIWETTVRFGNVGNTGSLLYRGFSRRLQPQTISGTVDLIFDAARQYSSSQPVFTRLFVYVVDTTDVLDPPVRKALLLNNYDEQFVAGAVPWAWKSTSWIAPRRLRAAAPLVPYTLPDDGRDYRLCVEVGVSTPVAHTGNVDEYYYTRMGTRSASSPQEHGYTPLPDLIPNGVTDIGAPYFEFSTELTFQESTYYVNDEPERAIDMGMSITVAPNIGVRTHSGLEQYYLWYKYTHDKAAERHISVLFCDEATQDSSGSGSCDLLVYGASDSLTDGPPLYMSSTQPTGSQARRSLMFSLRAGCNAYFCVQRSGSVTPATLLVVQAPTGGPRVGDMFVTLDNFGPNLYDPEKYGFGPAMWHGPDGSIGYASGRLPPSELGVSLRNGKFCVPEEGDGLLHIYDAAPSGALLHTVDINALYGTDIESTGTDMEFFYVLVWLDGKDFPTVLKISDEGVVVGPGWDMQKTSVGDTLKNFGVSRDGRMVYLPDYQTKKIYRHDLVLNIALPQLDLEGFLGPYPKQEAEEIIVLSNNNLVVKGDSTTWITTPEGVVLLARSSGNAYPDHITHTADDHPNEYWVWDQGRSDDFVPVGAAAPAPRIGSIPYPISIFIRYGYSPHVEGGYIAANWAKPMSSGTGLSNKVGDPEWGIPSSCSCIIMLDPDPTTPPDGGDEDGDGDGPDDGDPPDESGPDGEPLPPTSLNAGGIRVWSLEVQPTLLSLPEVVEGTVKSGQVVTYRVRATGTQNDPAEGELVNWIVTGAGTLLIAQSRTNANGYAMTQVQYGVDETGDSVVGATLLC